MKKEYIIYKLSDASKEACKIDNELFPMYNVKRGLRNEDGTGVLVGLTKVGNVVGYERLPEGGLKAIPGKLFYRGYDVFHIVSEPEPLHNPRSDRYMHTRKRLFCTEHSVYNRSSRMNPQNMSEEYIPCP